MKNEAKPTMEESEAALREKAPDQWSEYQAAALLARRCLPSPATHQIHGTEAESEERNKMSAQRFLNYHWAQKAVLEAERNLAAKAPDEWKEYESAIRRTMRARLKYQKDAAKSCAWS